MLKIPLIFSLVVLMQTADISITSPLSGDILRGQVEIIGNIDITGFSSAELAFSYASNPADTWFTLQTFPQPASDSTLAIWDTTTLTDGDYILHLRVFLQDGSSQDVVVSDIKIRNDTLPLTETPTVVFLPQMSSPLPAVTEKPVIPTISFPLSTALPPNPASVTNSSIYSNFGIGALVVLILFIVFSLLLRLRKS